LKRIDHVGVIVDDLDRLSRLLGEVLGLELVRTLEDPERGLRARFFRCGDADIELVQLDDAEARASRLGDAQARVEHIAIEVDDLAMAAGELALRGVRMTAVEPLRIGRTSSYFTEPASSGGVMLQFLQRSG
jgi:methylmalonyl-CoA/ethylmalonyl-CoA epimerase